MKWAKRLISVAVSVAILAMIYLKIDVGRMIEVFGESRPGVMTLALSLVVVTVTMTAWRLVRLAPKEARIELPEAVRLTLVASVLNLVLPSKMGDVAKAYFIQKRGHVDTSLSLSLVVYEKACDLLALLVWCVLGLVMLPHRDALFWPLTGVISAGLMVVSMMLGSRRGAAAVFGLASTLTPTKLQFRVGRLQEAWCCVLDYVWSSRRRVIEMAAMSLLIWLVHLVQIWLFVIALRGSAPFLVSLGLTPLAIFAGLLPLTLAGIGTRDAALIYFYAEFVSAEVAAALGLLCTLRYVLPALGGLPWLNAAYWAIPSVETAAVEGQ